MDPETQRNFLYMFYGFAAVWVILTGYVLTLVARERKLRREIENLKRMVGDKQ